MRCPPTPLVLWAARRDGARRAGLRPPDPDHATGATVGIPMLTSPLVRAGRPFELVVGLLDDRAGPRRRRAGPRSRPRGLAPAPRAHRTGRRADRRLRLRRRRRRRLAARGWSAARSCRSRPAEVLERYRAVDAGARRGAGAPRRGGLRRGPRPRARRPGALAARRVRARGPRARATGSTRARSTATSPRSASARRSASRPASASAALTSRGIPWSCAGDVPVAVAMLASKRLGGAAAVPRARGVRRRHGRVRPGQLGRARPRASARRAPAAGRQRLVPPRPARAASAPASTRRGGPATLLGSSSSTRPSARYRLIAADGEFTGAALPRRRHRSPAPSASPAGRRPRPGRAGARPASATTRRPRPGALRRRPSRPSAATSAIEVVAV